LILPASLHETADAAIEWFSKNWGLKRASIRVEEAFHPDVNFRPTFIANMDDGHVCCIEISQKIYSNTLDSVALDCWQKGLPVKIVVVTPKNPRDPNYSKKLKDAKRAGVGIFEIDRTSTIVVQQPLSLSLAGVRPIDPTEFPQHYRQNLQHAHQIFRDGEPNKACSLVYDELENACRRFAKKCFDKRLWANSGGLDITGVSWATLMGNIDRHLDRGNVVTRNVSHALISRIVGMTSHRNDSGHKPKNVKEVTRRDRELRTRFEAAIDLLKDFVDATKGFRI
jgi:hypothetical protein